MEIIIETIIGGLIVALIAGLTALAYKNPEEYKNLLKTVNKYLLQIIISIMGFSFGFFKTIVYFINNPNNLIKEKDVATIKQLISQVDKISNLFLLVLIVLILFSLYLVVLEKLPQIINKNKN